MDVSENPAGEPQTLAIRFANSDSKFFFFTSLLFLPPSILPYTKTLYNLPDANLFKEAFIKGQQEHEGDPQAPAPATGEL